MSPNQTLHTFIVKNKGVDNSYWEVMGEDILRSHLSKFVHSDWEELRSTLETWPSDELIILAVALLELKLTTDYQDINALYGYIFTLVQYSEADYLIQHLNVIDDNQAKSIKLLQAIRQRITKLQAYTSTLHPVHDYEYFYKLIDRLIIKNSMRG